MLVAALVSELAAALGVSDAGLWPAATVLLTLSGGPEGRLWSGKFVQSVAAVHLFAIFLAVEGKAYTL